jgi:hypothetical protein
VDPHPLAHPRQPVATTAARLVEIEPRAVVRYVDSDAVVADLHRHLHSRRLGVPRHVGQCLLYQPVRRELVSRRRVLRIAAQFQVDGEPVVRHLFHQLPQLRQTRLRRQLRIRDAVSISQRRQQPVQLAERAAARVPDPLEPVQYVAIAPVQQIRTGLGLDHHQVHRVRDHVMQVPCDVRPLGQDHLRRVLFRSTPLELGLARRGRPAPPVEPRQHSDADRQRQDQRQRQRPLPVHDLLVGQVVEDGVVEGAGQRLVLQGREDQHHLLVADQGRDDRACLDARRRA